MTFLTTLVARLGLGFQAAIARNVAFHPTYTARQRSASVPGSRLRYERNKETMLTVVAETTQHQTNERLPPNKLIKHYHVGVPALGQLAA